MNTQNAESLTKKVRTIFDEFRNKLQKTEDNIIRRIQGK